MTDTSQSGANSVATPPSESMFFRFLRATEIDTRLLGMLGALALIWIGFHLYGTLVNGQGFFFDAA